MMRSPGFWQSMSFAQKELWCCVNLVVRKVEEDGNTGTLYLTCSDLKLNTTDDIRTIYKKRWKSEEFHKFLKQMRHWQNSQRGASELGQATSSLPLLQPSNWMSST